MLRAITLLVGLLTLASEPAQSEAYYVSPLGTTLPATPNGSESLPFLSIQAAFASGKVKGGDRLLLKDGAYGAVTISANAAFDTKVEIISLNGKAAHFDSIVLAQNTRNLVFRNLSIWPRDPATGGALSLVRSYTTTSDITLDGLDVRSEEQADQFMQWDAAKWEARKFSGVILQGPRSVVSGSVLTGVYDGIAVGEDSQIIKNTVNGYNGDGLRAVSGSTVSHNTVTNCVATDANHDDGFQAYSSETSAITGLVLDSNIIIEWNGALNHPLRCDLQGLGLFDSPYEQLTIVNNIIAVSGYHGITVYGPRGAVIVNNTVVHSMGHTLGYPYIAIHPDKEEGTLPFDVLIANNVAMSIQGTANVENKVVFLKNSAIGTPSLMFEDPAAFNFRPKASSGFIDSADATVAPVKDVMDQPRPSGPQPDRGAYEVQANVVPVLEPDPVVEPETGTEPVPNVVPVRKPDPVLEPETGTEPVPDVKPVPDKGPKRIKPVPDKGPKRIVPRKS